MNDQPMKNAHGEGMAEIRPYPVPAIYSGSADYALSANGISIPLTAYTKDYDYAGLSVSQGEICYELTLLDGEGIHDCSISPKKLNIRPVIEGNKLTFAARKSEYLIIDINNRGKRLVIAADPEESGVPEASGEGIFNVTESPYDIEPLSDGAGVSRKTAALQQALDDASCYGTARGNGIQGIVYIPAGVYYISNVVIRSHTAVYLEPGAVVISTGSASELKEHWFKDSVGKPVTWWISTAYQSSNIKLYGRGTIDGNGEALSASGMINNLIVPISTSGFCMEGLTVRNSSAWAITPIRSNKLSFTDMKMFNSLIMGENDGIDVCESQEVVVRHAIGIGLDDPFSTKSWGETTDIASGKSKWPGEPEPVTDVLFEDCLAWTVCYGFKIGQGVIQNQERITFRNCVVYDAAVGFGIHHKYGTAEAKQIRFEHMEVENIHYMNDDNSAWMTLFIVNGNGLGVGPVSDVTVSNIKVYDQGKGSAKLQGAEGAQVSNVTFDHVMMPGLDKAAASLSDLNIHIHEYDQGITILPEHAGD